MERQPFHNPERIYQRRKDIVYAAKRLGLVTLAAVSLLPAAPTSSNLVVATPAAISQATLDRLSIPADLPDIQNTHWDDFHGSGAPINFTPSGFGKGRAEEGDEFMQVKRSYSGDWALGLIVSKDRDEPIQCGWVETLILSDKKVYNPANNPCLPFWGIMKNFSSFGQDPNGAPGKFVDGSPINISPKCSHPYFYGNYATPYWGPNNMSYPETSGGFYDKIRFVSSKETVWYRYTVKSRGAAEAVYVRIKAPDGKGGWGFMKRDCFDETPKGNAKEKTSETVPGANPDPDSKSKDK